MSATLLPRHLLLLILSRSCSQPKASPTKPAPTPHLPTHPTRGRIQKGDHRLGLVQSAALAHQRACGLHHIRMYGGWKRSAPAIAT